MDPSTAHAVPRFRRKSCHEVTEGLNPSYKKITPNALHIGDEVKLHGTTPIERRSVPLDALTRQTDRRVCSGMSWAVFFRKVLPATVPLSVREMPLTLFRHSIYIIKLKLGINNVTPVKIASFKSVNKSFRSCDICRNRYIMNIAQP